MVDAFKNSSSLCMIWINHQERARERERERESLGGMIHIRRCVEQVFNSREISEPGRHEFEVGVAPAFEEVEGQQVQVD
jgi:hypothetical protein